MIPYQDVLVRLLIGVLVIWLFERLLTVITIDAKLKELISIIVIVLIVLWALFGFVLLH